MDNTKNDHYYLDKIKKDLAFIVATYSIHHLTDRQKIAFIKELLNHLK